MQLKGIFSIAALAMLSALVFSGLVWGGEGRVKIDPKLPAYRPVSGVSGSIKSVGSDTMNNLMTLWAEKFQGHYPGVVVEIEGKGSSTAPTALTAGTSTFGPMSRKMKDKERDTFEKKFGYKATQLATAVDMLAVYVHKDNPINGLSLQQVDAIFSKTRRRGYPRDLKTWGDLGLTGAWKNRPITIYGRNSASGTYGYFKKKALFKGDYKASVKEQPGSSAVVTSIASDISGIGYSGIGYKTADVRAIPLAKRGKKFVPAKVQHVKKYPLARYLWLSVNYKPNSPLDPLRAEFIRHIYSLPGQAVVVKDGYFPISASVATAQLKKVGLLPGNQ